MCRLSYLFLANFLVLALSGSYPVKLKAQDISETGYNILDSALRVYRTDDRLVNGKNYKAKHIRAKGHPYFLTSKWTKSTLYIKGITFYDVPLKYDIVDDILIINNVSFDHISKNVILHSFYIDSLRIGSHFFHNTTNLNSRKGIGIAELIYQGNISAYYKHFNEFKEEYTPSLPFGKYFDPEKKLYLANQDNYTLIRSKKILIKYFEGHEKEVKHFLRRKKIRLKKASANQITSILKFYEQF